jgi:hypothetical protein
VEEDEETGWDDMNKGLTEEEVLAVVATAAEVREFGTEIEG